MKNWINKNYKTLIIAAFLIPILTVAVVSISHVTEWYGLSNPITWAVYLSIGIEIAALSALAAISANMGSKVYFPFAIVTVVQFIGNIFFAYTYIDIDTKQFKDWVDLVAPLVEFLGVDPTDYVGHKRFLALFSGGMLPLISLSFLHMLVKFTEEDRKNGEKLLTNQEELTHKSEKEPIISTPEDLKEFVDEVTRVRLSDDDLKILEETLLNPPPPNEKLVEAAEKYKETQKEALIEMMEYDQKLGLYDEPFENPLVKEPESELEIQEVEEPIENERTQLQKLEDYVKSPQNAQEMMLTTNDDIISSIPSDDEISDWDETLLDGIEEEVIFQEEPTIEEETQNFSTIEDKNENIFQEEPTAEFEVPEQEGWTEEKEQQFWEEQVPEPFATPEEVEKFKIDLQTIEEPQPDQTITVDEENFKPFDVDLKVEESTIEPLTEVTVEKKNL
jgi:uncharacterized protein (DUF1778 family)